MRSHVIHANQYVIHANLSKLAIHANQYVILAHHSKLAIHASQYVILAHHSKLAIHANQLHAKHNVVHVSLNSLFAFKNNLHAIHVIHVVHVIQLKLNQFVMATDAHVQLIAQYLNHQNVNQLVYVLSHGM